jgi:predicted transcriptional regulator YheO
MFVISKSGDRVCEFLGISKFTLYNYLDAIRKNGAKLEEVQ